MQIEKYSYAVAGQPHGDEPWYDTLKEADDAASERADQTGQPHDVLAIKFEYSDTELLSTVQPVPKEEEEV